MSQLRRRAEEIRLAMMMLTRLPAGRIARPIPLAEAAWAFPLVGIPVGLLAGGAHVALMGLGAAPALAAIGAVGLLALVTGGLHYDGLADFADGLAGADKERRLEIMRDSRIGSYGVLTLGLTLALTAAALADLGGDATLAAFLAIAAASRTAMLAVAVALPAARASGLGQMASGSGGRSLVVGVAIGLICVLPLGVLAIPVILAVIVAAGLVARLAWRRLGGQTGDVLGAVQVSSEAASWLALSLIVGSGAFG
ncbi:MAG: adenosylcobinamide-GDP ribazoletransferase [Pseudomonadota bacterium]